MEDETLLPVAAPARPVTIIPGVHPAQEYLSVRGDMRLSGGLPDAIASPIYGRKPPSREAANVVISEEGQLIINGKVGSGWLLRAPQGIIADAVSHNNELHSSHGDIIVGTIGNNVSLKTEKPGGTVTIDGGMIGRDTKIMADHVVIYEPKDEHERTRLSQHVLDAVMAGNWTRAKPYHELHPYRPKLARIPSADLTRPQHKLTQPPFKVPGPKQFDAVGAPNISWLPYEEQRSVEQMEAQISDEVSVEDAPFMGDASSPLPIAAEVLAQPVPVQEEVKETIAHLPDGRLIGPDFRRITGDSHRSAIAVPVYGRQKITGPVK